MTYSIIARCPRSGRFGVGSTTFSMACGRRNESVRPNVGVSKSQAFYLRYVDPLALNMLAQGVAAGIPPEVLHRIAAMACGGMDTLPHNGAVITLLMVSGLTHRQAYGDIFAITCLCNT